MRENFKEIELSDGTKVKCVPAPHLIIMKLLAEDRPPEIPVKTRELGIKDEEGKPFTEKYEDPDDPEYRSQVRKWVVEHGDRLNDIYLLLGTEVEVPDDDEWLEPLELLGVLPKKPENKSERKLFFLKYWLIKSADDLIRIMETIRDLTWPSEKEVEAAEASFPG